jgi:hypothetical protein
VALQLAQIAHGIPDAPRSTFVAVTPTILRRASQTAAGSRILVTADASAGRVVGSAINGEGAAAAVRGVGTLRAGNRV